MSEQSPQPDLLDRELIPARSRVSLSRDIGEAVVTENIFGTAKVRIIRPGDKLRRMLWTAGFIAAGIAAFVAWQVWLAAQQIEAESEVTPSAPVAQSVAPVEAASPVAPVPVVEAAPVAPHVAITPQHSSIPPTQPTAAVVQPRPVVAQRLPLAQPQSAAAAAGTLTIPAEPRVLPRRLPLKPAASAPVAATATASVSPPEPATIQQTSQPESEANRQ